MSRETIAEKATRYIGEGRLCVTHVGPAGVRATCRGNTGYTVTWTDETGWRCNCPARKRACAHVVAARLVTVAEGES
jgi:uncharacterized Zn finger protein